MLANMRKVPESTEGGRFSLLQDKESTFQPTCLMDSCCWPPSFNFLETSVIMKLTVDSRAQSLKTPLN